MKNNVRSTLLKTTTGHTISVTIFSPEKSNNKSIVISSATGVLQKYYSKFATHFSTLGFTVYTFDYYGIGKSKTKNIKQNTADLYTWALDQAAVIKFAKQEQLQHKITLVAHSIGGQLIGLNPEIHLVDSIVTIASQTGYWKYFKGFYRLRMIVFWYALIPITTPLFGYFPAKKLGLFENLPRHVVYQWRKWGVHPEYMFSEFSDLQFSNIKCNVLSLSFPRDSYAPKETVDWLASKFTNTKVDRRHLIPEDLQIEDVQHFGFFREQFKDSLWQLTENWIGTH
ncbi:alpha/beta fold hydrolase [Lacinutrix sp. WUR7]|uniref:alpha/beta hydrolase family protein n=1 Tax=Lacinutrix sp. WUR7 TaxID=2653681 RepID=UPI00193E4CBB|nr:alpha/beta fold hydrolase [Lacinutrix sp. WUR7]QRM87943.1 alpha/beta fold hydrolase [Lacinutrix sp. WUR7]